MNLRITSLLAVCALTSVASAGTVSVRAIGTVAGNSLNVSNLAGAPFGATVVMTFDVTTPGSPWPSAPADGTNYTIDESTFVVDVNGATLGMMSSSEALTLIDGFPVSDRLQINVGGLEAGLGMTYEVGFTGATFSSLDIEEQLGLYGFATLTSYNWMINAPGSGAMFIDFSSVEFLAGSLGTPFCFGDGTGNACPCGNTGAAGAGCANSAGSGATLSAVGSNSLGADDGVFTGEGMPNGVSALLFMGNNEFVGGNLFGDGLRCAGGQLKRLGVRTVDANGSASWSSVMTGTGTMPSDRRLFQVWYRDTTGPCAQAFNTSGGLDITFQP